MPAYVTIIEANTYWDDRDIQDSWTGLSSGTRLKALQVATDDVDRLAFDGVKYSGTEQILQFPRFVRLFAGRNGVVWDLGPEGSTDQVVVPQRIKDAVFQQARHIGLQGGPGRGLLARLRGGLTSTSVGSTSENSPLFTSSPK